MISENCLGFFFPFQNINKYTRKSFVSTLPLRHWNELNYAKHWLNFIEQWCCGVIAQTSNNSLHPNSAAPSESTLCNTHIWQNVGEDKMWFEWSWFSRLIFNTHFNIKDKPVCLFLRGKNIMNKYYFELEVSMILLRTGLTQTMQSSYKHYSLRCVCIIFPCRKSR